MRGLRNLLYNIPQQNVRFLSGSVILLKARICCVKKRLHLAEQRVPSKLGKLWSWKNHTHADYWLAGRQVLFPYPGQMVWLRLRKTGAHSQWSMRSKRFTWRKGVLLPWLLMVYVYRTYVFFTMTTVRWDLFWYFCRPYRTWFGWDMWLKATQTLKIG